MYDVIIKISDVQPGVGGSGYSVNGESVRLLTDIVYQNTFH